MNKSSKKSFLDELLATDSSVGGDARRVSKSVRFIDNEDDDILGSLLPARAATASSASRKPPERSSLDWLDSDSATKKASSSASQAGSKADWLGLSSDAHDEPESGKLTAQHAMKSAEPSVSDDDWLPASSTRRQRQTDAGATENQPSTMRHHSWLGAKSPSAESQSQSQADEYAASSVANSSRREPSNEPTVADGSAVTQREDGKSRQSKSAPPATSVHAPFTTSFTADSSLLLVQTQVICSRSE